VATYQITYTDTRFDNLSEEECMFKIEDLFKQGKLRLDTDKRVNMLSVSQIYGDELQKKLSTTFTIFLEKIMYALEIYERDTSGNQSSADKLLLDTLFFVLQARAK
jgi:hypothetical protein